MLRKIMILLSLMPAMTGITSAALGFDRNGCEFTNGISWVNVCLSGSNLAMLNLPESHWNSQSLAGSRVR